MNIYICRHGETDYNLNSIIQGQGVNTNLNKTGLDQAKDLAYKLKEIKFDIIFTSDLLRAKQTTEEISKYQSCKILEEKALRERNFGIYEGKVNTLYKNQIKKTSLDMWEFSPEGGESYLDVTKRVKPFIDNLLTLNYDNVLLSAHGGLNKVAIVYLMKWQLSSLSSFRQSNACINLISYNNKSETLKILNNIKVSGS